MDVLYVEALIGQDTVTTASPATLDAFRDHGRPRRTLEHDASQGEVVLAAAASHGLDVTALAEQLQTEGLAASAASHERLLATVEQKRQLLSAAGN